MGWITPLGNDIERVWKRMLNGENGIDRVTLFDASTYQSNFGAEVKEFNLADFLGPDVEPHAGCSRNTAFALAAATLAWKNAGLDEGPLADPSRVGVYLGGGEGPIDFDAFSTAAIFGCRNDDGAIGKLDTVRWAERALKLLSSQRELEQDPNLAAGHLAVQFGAAGPSFNTLTACAASTP